MSHRMVEVYSVLCFFLIVGLGAPLAAASNPTPESSMWDEPTAQEIEIDPNGVAAVEELAQEIEIDPNGVPFDSRLGQEIEIDPNGSPVDWQLAQEIEIDPNGLAGRLVLGQATAQAG
ncbi:MAG: hypothetical protein AAF560_15720 [Acidobacteriota bacterium]